VAEDTMAANIASRRKFMKIAGLVVFMFVMASVYAQQPLSDDKQILKLEDDWVRALKTKDRQLLDAIVAANFTFIEPDGTVKNRDDISRTDPVTLPIPNRSSSPTLKSVSLEIAH
jgi:hypothetical protein